MVILPAFGFRVSYRGLSGSGSKAFGVGNLSSYGGARDPRVEGLGFWGISVGVIKRDSLYEFPFCLG